MEHKKAQLTPKEIVVFAMLGSILFLSKLLMEWAPNIHLVGMLIMVYTLVYRKKAIIPLYLYVFLMGLFYGFATWWVPYLYIWTVLWAMTMLVPNIKSKNFRIILYIIVCGLHGFLFGILYAPAQAIFFGLDLKGTLSWIVVGFPFDIIHGVSNLLLGSLIYPLSEVLKKITKMDKKT